MFDELQRGIQGKQNLVRHSNTLPASDWCKDIAYVASWHGIGPEVIAAGLRMVADAIDPPPHYGPREDVAWIAENMPGPFDEKYHRRTLLTKQRPGLRPKQASRCRLDNLINDGHAPKETLTMSTTTVVAHLHHRRPYAVVLAVCPDCGGGLCCHCQPHHPENCGREIVIELNTDNLEVDYAR